MASILGLTESIMTVSGKTIKCMEMVLFFGMTENNIKASLFSIKDKVTVHFSGVMVVYMRVNGTKANNTAWVNSLPKTKT